jgi:hypothetical protein
MKKMINPGRKVLGAILACAISVTMMPFVGGGAVTSHAAVIKTIANTGLGVNQIENIQPGVFNEVVFGKANQKDDLIFNVLSKTEVQAGMEVNEKSLFLDCKTPIWYGSHNNQRALNEIMTAGKSFTLTEDNAVEYTNDPWARKGYQARLLSKADIEKFYGDNINSRIKKYNGSARKWWITNVYGTEYGYYVSESGDIFSDEKQATQLSLSPAINVTQSSILFSTKIGSVDQYHGRYRLTLVDKWHKVEISDETRCDGKVFFSYSAYKGLENGYNRMSIIITDKNLLNDSKVADCKDIKLYEYINLGTYTSDTGKIEYKIPDYLSKKKSGKDYYMYFTVEGDSSESASYFAMLPYQINVPDTDQHAFGSTYYKTITEPTCTQKGYECLYHKCQHCGYEEKATERSFAINPLKHQYGAPVYTFSDDGKTCTAAVTCTRPGCTHAEDGHQITEKVDTISSVKTPATVGKRGITTYTANFKNALFTQQTKDIEDLPALDKDGKPIEEAPRVGNEVPVTETQQDGVNYKVDGDGVSVEPSGNASGSITIPEKVRIGDKDYNVNKIAASAFKNSDITGVTIGANITEIGDSAFEGCKKLTKVTIGANVTKIGKKAFYKCPNLSKVTFKGTKVKSIGSKAFKKIKKGATFKTPKKKLKAYKKLLKGKTDAGVKIKK